MIFCGAEHGKSNQIIISKYPAETTRPRETGSLSAMMDEQRSAPGLVEVKSLVQKFASDFFAGGVASGFTKSAMAPIERYTFALYSCRDWRSVIFYVHR